MNVKLKNFAVVPSSESIVILSQNTIASNIYVLKGSATIEDYTKKSSSASIGVGQQLTIMKNDLTSGALQFTSKIEPLSDYIKTTHLFTKHNGDSLLRSNLASNETGSGANGSGGTGSVSLKNTKVGLTITSPEDESSVDTSEVNIEGKILNADITKVTINDKEALLNKEEKSFIYKSFPL